MQNNDIPFREAVERFVGAVNQLVSNAVPCRDTGYKDKHGTPIHEGDRIRWSGDGGEYIIAFSRSEQEWILKDDRPDYACPSLEGISSPQMSRVEIIGQ